MRGRKGYLAAIVLLGMACGAGVGETQELEARAYANTPVGVNFIGIGYGYSAGNVFFDPSLPFEDTDARTSVFFTRYVRSLSLFGKPAKIKDIRIVDRMEGKKIAMVNVEAKDKGIAIGKNGDNIKKIRFLAKRYFQLDTVVIN